MLKPEAIAYVAHELNRAYCVVLGDHSQVVWEDAPYWQRQSAINGVKFHLENPDATESHSHETWMQEKIDAGWKYGPTKDPDKKEHPCIVPFDELPLEQQIKDRLFKQTVDALRPIVRE